MEAIWLWVVESPFATATWVDWLDVLLLAVVIHRVLRVLRGTRAMQSLLGLVLLLALYALARYGGLSTLHWVLDNVFVYLVLALLILFQQDVRNALASAGGRLFFIRPAVERTDAAVLEEVVKASFSLARRKIGALILLEGTASLDVYCDAAHRLDANVSQELLQALFHPASPLHDGAVVIRKDRIESAGVFLPISLSKQVSRSFGTRHRAAIGVTEATDAICVVVSEERGTVAVVTHGEIVPVADLNDLRAILSEQLGRQARPVESSGAGVTVA